MGTSDSAVTAIKSQYARAGMSGSSAKQESIQSARLNAQSQGATIAVQLYDKGLQQAQLSDAIYSQLMQQQLQQDQNLSSAVGNFARRHGEDGISDATSDLGVLDSDNIPVASSSAPHSAKSRRSPSPTSRRRAAAEAAGQDAVDR